MNSTIFEQGGETTFATHRINTQNAVPISVPPYPLNGPKKQFLREELNRLVTQGIIEECESPWSLYDLANCSDEEEKVQSYFVSVDLPSYDVKSMLQKQMEDDEIKIIILSLEGEDPLEMSKWSGRAYVMNNGVLFRFNPYVDSEDRQLVTPKELSEDVLAQYHNSPTGEHYGIERTLQKISSKFYFTYMRKYIARHVKGCMECQRYKPENRQPAGLLQTPAPSQRFEVVVIDIFGALPATPRGNRWILIIEDVASK
ncbi:hypothetical protein Zmor_017885 [Zophobas morio]|uniref:RNA-directed DNA polymerase n=1 Tax=Zophobas morio TaxID=2755281 RepID=A0AA38IA38_9CUCU|nr:hypothetical protein Zmor_017885 [Zophobas morio]